jgi:hypothetical protein
VLCGDAGVPVLNTAGGACFLGLVVMAVLVVRAERTGDRARHRRAVVRFIAYAVAASFASGLTQRDLWPFAKWPMAGGRADAVAANTRIKAVDAGGAEHDIDYRAWQPLAFDDLVPWMHRTFDRLPPESQARIAEHLLRLAEQGRARARAGRGPGYFDRYLGPLAAPDFDLHPRRWRSPAETPALPFAALRVYRERWNQEERRLDPARVERSLAFEYRP